MADDVQKQEREVLLSKHILDALNEAENPNIRNPFLTIRGALLTFADELGVFHPAVATIVDLKAINSSDRKDRMLCYVEDDPTATNNGLFRFDQDSIAAENIPEIVAPDVGLGRWVQITKGVALHDALGGIKGDTPPYHLSEDKYNAAAGSDGSPSNTNRFVTSSDPRLVPANINHNALAGKEGGDGTEFNHLGEDDYDATNGTDGTPSDTNRFVTDSDNRLITSSHNHNDLANKQGGATGQYNHLNHATYAATAGTVGTPSGTNKFVTNDDTRLLPTNKEDYCIRMSRRTEVTNVWLNGPGNGPSNNVPWTPYKSIQLVGIAMNNYAPTETWTAEVHHVSSGSNLSSPPSAINADASLTITNGDVATVTLTTPVAFSNTDKIGVYCRGTLVYRPSVTLFFKEA